MDGSARWDRTRGEGRVENINVNGDVYFTIADSLADLGDYATDTNDVDGACVDDGETASLVVSLITLSSVEGCSYTCVNGRVED